MMRKILIIWTLLSIALFANAQLSGFKPNESTRLVVNTPKVVKQKSVTKKVKGGKTVEVKDYELYRSVVRRFSWIEGLGNPITQEEANHLPCYFKLSLKNSKGHWQHIQAMHGNVLSTQHGFDTYIIDTQNDNTYVLKEWREQFAKVCQWYITSDLSGENVAEERAYDKNGYMIYGFQPIKNGKDRVVASYTNGYGYPIDVNESDSYTYGNVVMITYDKHGNDSIVDYLDGAGLRRVNNDGVDQRRYEYDSFGRLMGSYSCNAVGDKMMDNWGNCGNVIKYDVNGRDYTVTRVDADGNPIRMPGNRAKDLDTYISCLFKLDKWHRVYERIYLDENGKDDSTLGGVHRVLYLYSDKGILLSEKHYDINNQLIK